MTHVTCWLTAKNCRISSGTLPSVIEYGLPGFRHPISCRHWPPRHRSSSERVCVVPRIHNSFGDKSLLERSAVIPPTGQELQTFQDVLNGHIIQAVIEHGALWLTAFSAPMQLAYLLTCLQQFAFTSAFWFRQKSSAFSADHLLRLEPTPSP